MGFERIGIRERKGYKKEGKNFKRNPVYRSKKYIKRSMRTDLYTGVMGIKAIE